MNNNLLRDSVTQKIKNRPSLYNPSKAVKDTQVMVQEDYQIGHQIMNRSFREFNDRNVIEYLNDNQRAFNTYVPPRSSDPDESWRAQTVRPVTRNKIISIAAHVTTSIIIPSVWAQNSEDQEDKEAADVMKDLMEWTIDNSDYERKYIFGIISSLVAPAIIMEAEYVEVMQKIREKKKDGTYTEKEIIDEVMSGFNAHIVPVDEIYIANPYEHNIQRQRFLIRRKLISYPDAKALYEDHEDFKHVTPGVRHIFVDGENTFYEQDDEDLKGELVEMVVYYNRSKDLFLCYLNGILVTDYNQPNPRNDKLYPFAKSGFEPIDEGRFFYFKSCADKMGPDQELVDVLYNMVLDGTFLALMPPMALYGNEEIGSSVFVPGMVTSLREDSKLDTIGGRSDLRGGLEAINLVERSLSESSADPILSGNQPTNDRATAFQVSSQQQNAQISLTLFSKMIGFLVVDFGHLMVGDILQHMTVGEVAQITDTGTAMKYKSFVLPDKIEDGKKVSKKIEFTNKYAAEPEDYTKDRMMEDSFDVLEEEMKYEGKVKIKKVNPAVFTMLKFKLKVTPDIMRKKNEALEKALNLEAYDRLIQNPNVDQVSVTRDFLVDTYRPGEGDKYMAKQLPPAQGDPADLGNPNQPSALKGINSNITGQMTGSNSLSALLSKQG